MPLMEQLNMVKQGIVHILGMAETNVCLSSFSWLGLGTPSFSPTHETRPYAQISLQSPEVEDYVQGLWYLVKIMGLLGREGDCS